MWTPRPARARAFWRPAARRLGLDRNPMRRPADRADTAAAVGLATVFLLLVPLVVMGVGHHLETSWRWAERTETARHRVTATLLRDAEPPVGRLGTAVPKVPVPARWAAPDGSARFGDLRVPSGEKAGGTAAVWIDGEGRSVDPPLRRSQLAGQKAIVSGFALAALSFALIGARQAVRHVLDRRRMACWEEEWSAVEPRWTRRRR
ncbi:Rv1733c family protein [Actinoallomurus iriomotensis]|uniref:Transmembrane protein n=1 Tax=Actinoallomurus iriomotensis TaxID=478107 RepID=A0A9W6RS64_9ACTN|nr:hypothetical protein [Actinoallomurus iriomotensis]GLY80640.1 hypothetical protein Airi01_089070 [Actinoallomurus iriomotensis]